MCQNQKHSQVSLSFQDCAAVILYNAEEATKNALDSIQILGKT